MLNFIAWAPARTPKKFVRILRLMAKFATSLNKVFFSKYLFVIFLLLFIHSFQVASDFPMNPTNLHIHCEIRYASMFSHVRKN